MKPASLLTSMGSLTNASINRSPYAYEQNPDKDEYVCTNRNISVIISYHHSYDANVDHLIYVLKIIDETKKPLGMIRYN